MSFKMISLSILITSALIASSGCASGPSQQDIAIANSLVALHARCKSGDHDACEDYRDDLEILAVLHSGGGRSEQAYPSTIWGFNQREGASFWFLN